MTQTKIYFLAPGWDIPPTAGTVFVGASGDAESPLSLGSIITNPAVPQITLFRPSALDIAATGAVVHTSEKLEFSGPMDVGRDHRGGTAASSAGLFGMFLSLYGLGDEPAYDRGTVLSYSFHHLRTQRLAAAAPSPILLAGAGAGAGTTGVEATAPRVVQFCRASGYRAPVYMVTEVKTVRGAGVTTASRRGKGWRVSLGVGATTPLSAASLASEHAYDGDCGREEEGAPQPIVYAFQLTELRLAEDGTITESDFSARGLHEKLDKDFGSGIFAVVEGFDEEDGSSCRIVQPSPARVDFLTASSAKMVRRRQEGEL